MTPGRFITVEGIEGVGKSSHVAAIAEALKGQGHQVVTTREPGGSPVADRIRALLLDPEGDAPAAKTELLLIFAARAEHLATRIEPALARGEWVVCDRFTDATYAYQGGGRGIERARIAELERWVQGGRRPDLTLLLDAPAATALERIGVRDATDRFEREQLDFFERARAVYLERGQAEPDRFRVIDASQPLDAVRAAVVATIAQWRDSVA
jgi:dTMP kinase